LMVSDRTIERGALATSLRSTGVDTVEVDDLATCARELRANGDAYGLIDLLIVDAEADPAVAGEILRAVRERACARKVRGIVMINAVERPGLAAFRAEGFDSYLLRPVRFRSLMAQLSTIPPNRIGNDDCE